MIKIEVTVKPINSKFLLKILLINIVRNRVQKCTQKINCTKNSCCPKNTNYNTNLKK